MGDDFDSRMMDLALQVARHGQPSPNPHVGAVVVRGRQLLATGFHACAGQAHAEIEALRKLGGDTRETTVYVTLEPCNHHGRTGPCSEALLAAGVRRVVVGCEDPVPGHGGGAERLRAAGVDVTIGVRRNEAELLIADFRKHALQGLPYVTLLSGSCRSAMQSDCAASVARPALLPLREGSDAILIGIGSVLARDPAPASASGAGRPRIAIVDTSLRTPPDARALACAPAGSTVILHAADAEPTRGRALRERGAALYAVPRSGGGLDLEQALRVLAREGVVRVLAEGGPTLQRSLLVGGLIDQIALES